MRRLRATGCTALLLVAGCRDCGREAGPIAPADATVSPVTLASVQAARVPMRVDIIARTRAFNVRLVRLGSTLLLDTGVFVYSVSAESGVTRLGDAASYVPLLAEGSADPFGYEGRPSWYQRAGLGGDGKAPIVRFSVLALDPADGGLVGHEHGFAWDGRGFRRIEALPKSDERMGAPSVDHPPPASGLPITTWHDWQKLRDGRVAWSGRTVQGHALLYLTSSEGRAKVIDPFEGVAGVGPDRGTRCEMLPSADGEAYARCETVDGSSAHEQVFRLDGEALHEVGIPSDLGLALAFDVHGCSWHALRSTVGVVNDGRRRFARDCGGLIDVFDYPAPDASLERPKYEAGQRATKIPGTAYERRWITANIVEDRSGEELGRATEIVPMDDGSLFALVEDGDNTALVRIGRPQSTPAVVSIGSEVDQEIEARNTQPLRPWSGHCPQVFVRLSGPDARIDEKKSAIEAIAKPLSTAPRRATQVALVEGRLGGERVAGVVFLRIFPDSDQSAMEAAVSATITRFTADPASPPRATCTLPILERVVFMTQPPDMHKL